MHISTFNKVSKDHRPIPTTDLIVYKQIVLFTENVYKTRSVT